MAPRTRSAVPPQGATSPAPAPSRSRSRSTAPRNPTTKVAKDSNQSRSRSESRVQKLDVNPAESNKGSEATASTMNPQTTHFEFGGAWGASFLIAFLPAVCYFLFFFCNKLACPSPNLYRVASVGQFVENAKLIVSNVLKTQKCFTWEAMAVFLSWMAWVVLLQVALPGDWVNGTKLRTGKLLKYKINAWPSFLMTIIALFVIALIYGFKPFLWVSANFLPLLTAAFIYSVLQSTYLYIRSFSPTALLALGGNSGNPIYDFWIGRELNPRVTIPFVNHDFDLKVFCELRPGLIGWFVLNLCFALTQYQSLGRITDSMALVLLFEAWYTADALFNEAAVLTTMDVTTDGFGFMLTFGDLVWVPFTYCLQARYLSMFPLHLGPLYTIAILLVKLFGFWIFRSSNNEKNVFRTNPNHPTVKHLKTLSTKAGTKLIISGWWGVSRHINYFGDWIMGVAWCLPCGFDSIIPYFYAFYFLGLLVHREIRDEEKCRNKYGEDWDKYCQIVRWRIIPYVY